MCTFLIIDTVLEFQDWLESDYVDWRQGDWWYTHLD